MNYRTAADRVIDQAHCRIASAEMTLAHSFTDVDRQTAHDEIFAAQRYLRRACEAKQAWYASDPDEYAEYPPVAYDDQYMLDMAAWRVVQS